MKKRRRPGRVARKRRRKCGMRVQSVSLCHQASYVRLIRFLKQRGFASTILLPAQFTDTGRGLQTLKTVKPGQLLISLPQACLLTTTTVLNSYLGPLIKGWMPHPSPLLVLCVFLVLERHRVPLSEWYPYIDVLPTTYTCPVYFADDVIALLPKVVQRHALEQRASVQELHSSNQDFFRWLQPLVIEPVEEVFTYEALRWAWCTVNTRSVFMAHSPSQFLSGQDVCALAPFLDLLNHRPDVQVSANFNSDTRCYEIHSVSGIDRYQQAFINYGSHDNQRLLVEYGFVATNNPHSVVYLDKDILCKVLQGDSNLQQKIKFLSQNELLSNLTLSSEGPGWRLQTVVRVLSLPQTQFGLWKAVLLGQRLCEEKERWCTQTIRTLCVHRLQDTDTALEKISKLQQQCDASVTEQLDVVMALRQEERIILGKCLEILTDS
ncbi:SET domain-containing protein 4 isoform X2 [Boleophthalmus pectinirostris]|nr:SET domain-containing protein 4 isoform X2 [Boleophthalmus pectinirostris]XP_055018455.1 SET domain-containing protein 4 isoform X2 [Boleophthalmus pectinirostris]XP_055018458.1 SET domain-containing protein 4 isoform X2 [Boleophthalmus pectinirostris]